MQRLHQFDQHNNDHLPFSMCHGEWAIASLLLWLWLSLYNQTDQRPLDVHFKVIPSRQTQNVILCAASISQEVAVWASGGKRTEREATQTHLGKYEPMCLSDTSMIEGGGGQYN